MLWSDSVPKILYAQNFYKSQKTNKQEQQKEKNPSKTDESGEEKGLFTGCYRHMLNRFSIEHAQ